jgi:hypothetical protein
VRKLREWRQSSLDQRVGMHAFAKRVRARTWDDMAGEIAGLMSKLSDGPAVPRGRDRPEALPRHAG